jgi:hypothetical protein
MVDLGELLGRWPGDTRVSTTVMHIVFGSDKAGLERYTRP